jgi:hypothetical protein
MAAPPSAAAEAPIWDQGETTDNPLAGRSKAKMYEGLKASFDKKELPALEPGAMCSMLSKDGYLGDGNGHWHPHLMWFVPLTDEAAWGANLAGSQVLASKFAEDHLTIFMVPVAKWSDGTVDHPK